MTRIRIDTGQVENIAMRLTRMAYRFHEIRWQLNHAINRLDMEGWEGENRTRIEPQLSRMDPQARELAGLLDEQGKRLMRIAGAFERADNESGEGLAAIPWDKLTTIAAASAAAAAGVATPAIMLASLPLTGDYPDVSKLDTWKKRLAYAEELPGQIEALEDEQKRWKDQIAQDDQDIDDLDRQIQDLQAKRDALQEEADDLLNKIKPDGLHWGFDDGIIDAPWRTKSDALEDQITEYDRQIQELQAQKDLLVQQRQAHQQELGGVDQQLDTLRQSQAELDKIIQEGIPFDGPSAKYPYFPAGNCTKYAASKRNVPCSGHAHKWDDQARNAGYAVGNYPVKGSVMVWEKTVKGADSTYGHVAIVEKVDKLDDGSLKVWYTDNHNTDPAHPEWRIIEPGAEDISFIYEKLPEST